MSIAGTEMQCIEIYTGESYTLPIAFTDANTAPINTTGWTLSTSAKFYTVDTIEYGENDDVILGNLTLNSPQPSTGAGTYSANLVANFTTPASGLGYLYIPADLTGGTGSPNATPTISLANNANNSTIVVVTLGVSRTDPLSAYTDYNKEPIGIVVRYQ
jgi:hypothetical protein